MLPGSKRLAGVTVLFEKIKTRYYAEHEDTDGGLRQPAITGKNSHKGPLANDQLSSSTFPLDSALARGCDRSFNRARNVIPRENSITLIPVLSLYPAACLRVNRVRGEHAGG